jgi:hypothetical protein
MEKNDFEEVKTVDQQIIEIDEKGEGYSFVENTELSELEQEEMIDIDIKSLFEQVQKEQVEEEVELEKEVELDEEIYKEADDEEIELSEELEESLNFDYNPVPKGQTTAYGATREQQAEEAMLMDVMLAIEEENSKLEKKNESLVRAGNQLKKSNQKLKETVQNIANKFKEIKLINSKLFYTNKTLMDASLNERQKGNLVESINNAQTSERAKIVYETLKNTVGNATAKEQPKSLSEAVGKRSSTSLLLKAQKSDNKPKVNESNLFAERMQALAGIKYHKED